MRQPISPLRKTWFEIGKKKTARHLVLIVNTHHTVLFPRSSVIPVYLLDEVLTSWNDIRSKIALWTMYYIYLDMAVLCSFPRSAYSLLLLLAVVVTLALCRRACMQSATGWTLSFAKAGALAHAMWNVSGTLSVESESD